MTVNDLQKSCIMSSMLCNVPNNNSTYMHNYAGITATIIAIIWEEEVCVS